MGRMLSSNPTPTSFFPNLRNHLFWVGARGVLHDLGLAGATAATPAAKTPKVALSRKLKIY